MSSPDPDASPDTGPASVPASAPASGGRSADTGFIIGAHRFEAPRLEPGLYIVSTPIGNLGDMTVRGLETLASASLIACEDTRITAKLVQRFGLRTPLIAYHEHNANRMRPRLLAALENGEAVALVSDAGTPLVSDPGYRLVRDVVAAGHRVIPVPGANAPFAALVGAGLASDTVCFAGFLPQKSGARSARLAELRTLPTTLILFESPHRLARSLADMVTVLGPDREATVARELTKRFETFERGTLGSLAELFADQTVKGEIVVVIGPPQAEAEADAEDADALLIAALAGNKAATAAKLVAQKTGLDRKTLYARALELKAGPEAADEDESDGEPQT
ncbi:16S rRNA (cytidine(1402)-2'-O)-methyltransferase [Stappia indica]|uniref:16S rRNA (cytidine(1402)-2'-O)-methyltransferase n=1 Tax=Stappia indica TaxID=538381 RepID=UPI00384F31DC